MLVLLGGALLAVAVVGAVVALRDWSLWNVLRRVRPTSPERLIRAARNGQLDGRLVAVSGLAGPAPDGPLRSAINHEPCVWHRHTVHRRRIHYRSAEGGTTTQRYSLRRRRIADVASRESFLLRPAFPRAGLELAQPAPAARVALGEESTVRISAIDGLPERTGTAGVLVVRPEGMRVHRPVARGIRILPALASEPFPEAEALMGRVPQMYWHREWLLPPGAPVFVLAELRCDGPAVVLHRPARGPHVVSTRTAIGLRRRTIASVLGGLALAVLAGVAGAAVLIVHFV